MNAPANTLPAVPSNAAPAAPIVLARASLALGKIDLWGRRGLTMVSLEEIEAMALLLAALGFVPTEPGKALPATYFMTVEGAVK